MVVVDGCTSGGGDTLVDVRMVDVGCTRGGVVVDDVETPVFGGNVEVEVDVEVTDDGGGAKAPTRFIHSSRTAINNNTNMIAAIIATVVLPL